MKYLLLFIGILIFLSFQIIYSQPGITGEKSDSLSTVIDDSKQPDEERLNAFYRLIWDGYLFYHPDSALLFADELIEMSTNMGNEVYEAKALNIKGAASSILGEFNNAETFYKRCYDIRLKLGDKSGSASAISNIAIIDYKRGDYLNALKKYQEALSIKKELKDQKGILLTSNNIANCYLNLGKLDEALKFYQECLEIFEKTDIVRGYGQVLNNIGNVYQLKAKYAESLEFYKKSSNYYLKTNDVKGQASSLINQGLIYYKQGHFKKALKLFKESEKLNIDIGNKDGIATSYINQNLVYTRIKKVDTAKIYFSKLIDLYNEMENLKGLSIVYNNLGLLYQDNDQLDSGYLYFEKSVQIDQQRKDDVALIGSRGNLGNVMIRNHQLDKGINLLEESFQDAIEFQLASHQMILSEYLYQAYLKMGDKKKALGYLTFLNQKLNKQLELNYFVLPENEKEKFFKTLEPQFNFIYDFVLNYGDSFDFVKDTAYNIALMNKGLSLKSTKALRNEISSSKDSTLIQIFENWMLMKRKIAKAYQSNSNDIEELTEKANLLEIELMKKSNAFSDFQKSHKIKWNEVRDTLKQDEVAIEFIHFKSDLDSSFRTFYAALIIRPGYQHPEIVKLCTQKEIEDALGIFQGNDLIYVNKVYGTNDESEPLLFNRIWKPLEQYLKGCNKIYFSASGLLHKISFDALSISDNMFLSDLYELYPLSSTGMLLVQKDEVDLKENDEFLVMGGIQYTIEETENEVWSYLPGSKEETENIVHFLNDENFIYNYVTDTVADEYFFKKSAPKHQFVHIATHGFFFPDPNKVINEQINSTEYQEEINFRGTSRGLYADWSFINNENPLMRSGIVLAGANNVWDRDVLTKGEDGVLTAQEVTSMNLQNNKLVVLSACETGLGDINGSEGVYGLQRAFKMAGVEYMLMSLWQVPDKETSEFMQLFYINLYQLKNVREAFNQTKKAMRKKYDPYYWGAFILLE